MLHKRFPSKQNWDPSLLFSVTTKTGQLLLNLRRQLRATAKQTSWGLTAYLTVQIAGHGLLPDSHCLWQPFAGGIHYFLFELRAADTCPNLKLASFSPMTFSFQWPRADVLPTYTHHQEVAKTRLKPKDVWVQNYVLSTWTCCHSRYISYSCTYNTICMALYSLQNANISQWGRRLVTRVAQHMTFIVKVTTSIPPANIRHVGYLF